MTSKTLLLAAAGLAAAALAYAVMNRTAMPMAPGGTGPKLNTEPG